MIEEFLGIDDTLKNDKKSPTIKHLKLKFESSIIYLYS